MDPLEEPPSSPLSPALTIDTPPPGTPSLVSQPLRQNALPRAARRASNVSTKNGNQDSGMKGKQQRSRNSTSKSPVSGGDDSFDNSLPTSLHSEVSPTPRLITGSTDPSEDDLSGVRRSGRRRAAPSKMSPPPPESQLTTTAKAAPRRKLQPVRGNFSATYLLTNPKSKLAEVNLPDLLSQDGAWTQLSREEQMELISLIPGEATPQMPADEPLPNVPRNLLKRNSSFMSDVRLFQEELAAGRFDPVWLRDAQNAMEKRARGDFDDWKEKNREEFWGQDQKLDWRALAGESKQHGLTTLVKAGYVEVGDIWVYRTAGNKEGKDRKSMTIVEKEAKIIGISQSNTLSFSFPPGQHKFSSPVNGADLICEDVTGPSDIGEAILEEDGRLAGVRRANMWKDFRCFRKNQDMGSLWDIRELYHIRQGRQ